MVEKKRILAWHDAPQPLVHTGYAKVAKYVLRGLYDTGKYDIDVLAVNYFGQFFDKEDIPYQIVPAKLGDPRDPFGFAMLERELLSRDYDILFVLNDIYVTQRVHQLIGNIKVKKPGLRVIYYYPVDCSVQTGAADFIKIADKAYTYNNWSVKETEKALPFLKGKIGMINHGVDTDVYRKLSPQAKAWARKKYFGLEKDDDAFIFINVNRNSPRKDLPRCLYAFKKLKEQSDRKLLLYLHTMPKDQGIDLFILLKELDLNINTDVIFPHSSYNLISAASETVMNQLYNAADCCITTTLGEGWGLSTTEAMGAETLTLSPLHTSFTEITNEGERGLVYECKDKVWIDNSGIRPQAHIVDIIDGMQRAIDLPEDKRLEMTKKARAFTETIGWPIIQNHWRDAFNNVSCNVPTSIVTEEL